MNPYAGRRMQKGFHRQPKRDNQSINMYAGRRMQVNPLPPVEFFSVSTRAGMRMQVGKEGRPRSVKRCIVHAHGSRIETVV